MLLPTQDKEAKEKIANRIIVDCGFETEYPCPHTPGGNPFGSNILCKHEDKDICIWQLEQAEEMLRILEELGYHKGLPSSIEEALNSGDGVYRP